MSLHRGQEADGGVKTPPLPDLTCFSDCLASGPIGGFGPALIMAILRSPGYIPKREELD
jgi:hypothetical protein